MVMSDSLIPISDEQAKLGQEALKALRGLGGFFEQALGSVPEDLIGYLGGDWLRVRRGENIARMLRQAKARLEATETTDIKPATLTVALPILQGAADEDRDELVDLWARLLANAMDPTLCSVRARFIDAVKQMDPPDAVLLRYMYSNKIDGFMLGDAAPSGTVHSITPTADRIGYRRSSVEASIVNLVQLGLLIRHTNQNWYATAMFREFGFACYPEAVAGQ
jgi:hypothetical protein